MTPVTTDAPPMPIWNGQRSEGWGSRAMGAVSASVPSSFGAASPFNGFIGSGQQQLSTGSQPQWPALQDVRLAVVDKDFRVEYLELDVVDPVNAQGPRYWAVHHSVATKLPVEEQEAPRTKFEPQFTITLPDGTSQTWDVTGPKWDSCEGLFEL